MSGTFLVIGGKNRVHRMLFCEAKKFIKRENKRNDMAGEVSLLLKIKITSVH